MIESTNRPAWTQTIWQGMGNGLNAFKHKIIRKGRGSETDIVRDYPWTADADGVKSTGGT